VKIDINNYLRLIRKKAWEYSHAYGMEFEEVESEGFLIFAETAEMFNESRGIAFGTYLWHRLRKLGDFCKKQKMEHWLSEINEETFHSVEFDRFTAVVDFYDSVEKDLSDDAVEILDFVLSWDGIGRKPSLYATTNRFHYRENWRQTRVQKAWAEIKTFWNSENFAYSTL
jgi:hypothetical protein